MNAKRERIPEVLRQALAEELQLVAGYPRKLIEDDEVSDRLKLEAWDLLAKYWLGTASEVRQSGEVLHGVVMLPPLDTPGRLASGPSEEIQQDAIELTD